MSTAPPEPRGPRFGRPAPNDPRERLARPGTALRVPFLARLASGTN
ncbi:hypothetical protein ACN6LH_004375 [Streptomyces sp. SAS_276]